MKAVIFAFLLVGLSAVLGIAVPTEDELTKLTSAMATWKKLSEGSHGYLIQHQASQLAKLVPAALAKGPSDLEDFPTIIDDKPKTSPSYVDGKSGAVHRVCDNAVPTVAPTKPPKMSLPVMVIHRVEEMFAKLKKILQEQLCKVVKIVYSEDKAYPVIAKLAGCKSPEIDSILELGTVVLTPKSHASSKDALCKFAKAHSKVIQASTKKALAAFLPYIRVGTVLPQPVVDPMPMPAKPQRVNPEKLQKALDNVKSAIDKIAPTQAPAESVKSLESTLKATVGKHFTPKVAQQALVSLKSAVLQHMKQHPMPKGWEMKAVEPRPANAHQQQGKVTPENMKSALDEMKKAIADSIPTQAPSVAMKRLHAPMQEAVAKHFKPADAFQALSVLKSAVLEHLKHHPMPPVEQDQPEDDGDEFMDGQASLPDEEGYGDGLFGNDNEDDDDQGDKPDTNGSRHHHRRHHGRYAHARKVRRIIFYTCAGVLGLAAVYTLYRSIRECRKHRRVAAPSKEDASVSYAILAEDEEEEPSDMPPAYHQARGVVAPSDV